MAVAKKQISQELKILERYYDRAKLQLEKDLVGRLALLELCGWIEETVDDIALKYMKRKIRNEDRIKEIQKNLIDRVSGFTYPDHISRIFLIAFGSHALHKIENRIKRECKKGEWQKFINAITQLAQKRRPFAHTHASARSSLTHVADHPNVTIAQFNYIYPILKKFESYAKQELG